MRSDVPRNSTHTRRRLICWGRSFEIPVYQADKFKDDARNYRADWQPQCFPVFLSQADCVSVPIAEYLCLNCLVILSAVLLGSIYQVSVKPCLYCMLLDWTPYEFPPLNSHIRFRFTHVQVTHMHAVLCKAKTLWLCCPQDMFTSYVVYCTRASSIPQSYRFVLNTRGWFSNFICSLQQHGCCDILG